MSAGFRIEKAGPAATMRQLDTVFVAVWQSLLLADVPPPLTLFGAGLILCGSAALTLSRGCKAERSKSEARGGANAAPSGAERPRVAVAASSGRALEGEREGERAKQ